MSVPTISIPMGKLVKLGLTKTESIHYQSTPEELVQDTLRMGEGTLTDTGALAINTGEFTGRSPQDKFTVKDEVTENTVHWNNFNLAIEEKYFFSVREKIMNYLNEQPEIWVRDCYACADPRYRLNIRVVTEKPWTNLFAYNMFLRPEEEELEGFEAEWHVLSAPGLRLDPATDGTRQHNAAIVSFKHKTILIAGTGYTGETKKGIFTILNYILPQEKNVLSMHCSA
ncbi:MAG: phosphoenolpyruvate carboxykinase (ATP), partial [Chitinophagaceae bacterium]